MHTIISYFLIWVEIFITLASLDLGPHSSDFTQNKLWVKKLGLFKAAAFQPNVDFRHLTHIGAKPLLANLLQL